MPEEALTSFTGIPYPTHIQCSFRAGTHRNAVAVLFSLRLQV